MSRRMSIIEIPESDSETERAIARIREALAEFKESPLSEQSLTSSHESPQVLGQRLQEESLSLAVPSLQR